MAVIPVDIAGRPYDVMVGAGLLAELAEHCRGRLRKRDVPIITDAHVHAAWGSVVEIALRNAGHEPHWRILPPGESTKSWRELSATVEWLLAQEVERGDHIIALGGGVIGDLAGFAASILRRGVRYVQVPTTLLAQVDSSVGGKTGINAPQGKNLIGSFHQPSLVLADTSVLATLPERQMRAGYAEVAKYGLLGDATFYNWLEGNWQSLFRHEPSALTRAIARSVEMKAEIVVRDETESGDRMLLNLGHTFGHALEAATSYSDRLLHGEAVSIGMCLAIRLSEELNICRPQTAARVAAHLKSVGLPTELEDIPGAGDLPGAEGLLELMRQDKKVRQGRLTLILLREIGNAFATREVEPATLLDFLRRTRGA